MIDIAESIISYFYKTVYVFDKEKQLQVKYLKAVLYFVPK